MAGRWADEGGRGAVPPCEVTVVEGLEVRSRVPADSGDALPLLFVHGASQAAWCWDEHWMPALAARGWACHAVSLRGHGNSTGAARLRTATIRDYSDDVLQVIVRLPRPPVLIGHSMGGRIVQDVCARYPAAGAVFVASVGPRHDLAFLGNLARHEPAMLARSLLPAPPPPRPDPPYLFGSRTPNDVARAHIARLQPESTVAALQIIGPHRFRAGEQPVLVLTGALDRTLSVADSLRLARAYGVEAHVLDGLGHELMLEARWSEPLALVEEWLTGAFAPRRAGR